MDESLKPAPDYFAQEFVDPITPLSPEDLTNRYPIAGLAPHRLEFLLNISVFGATQYIRSVNGHLANIVGSLIEQKRQQIENILTEGSANPNFYGLSAYEIYYQSSLGLYGLNQKLNYLLPALLVSGDLKATRPEEFYALMEMPYPSPTDNVHTLAYVLRQIDSVTSEDEPSQVCIDDIRYTSTPLSLEDLLEKGYDRDAALLLLEQTGGHPATVYYIQKGLTPAEAIHITLEELFGIYLSETLLLAFAPDWSDTKLLYLLTPDAEKAFHYCRNAGYADYGTDGKHSLDPSILQLLRAYYKFADKISPDYVNGIIESVIAHFAERLADITDPEEIRKQLELILDMLDLENWMYPEHNFSHPSLSQVRFNLKGDPILWEEALRILSLANPDLLDREE